MKNAEMLARVNTIKERADLDADTRAALEALAFDLFQEMSKTPSASNKAAAGTIARMLKAQQKSPRECLRYAWTDKNGMQCTCDGFRAYRLREALPLPALPENVDALNLDAIFQPAQGRKNVSIPWEDRGRVKAFIEMQRAEHGEKHIPLWDFGDDLPTVNALYLYELLTVFPDAQLFADPDNTASPVYAASSLGDGILLPVRVDKKLARATARQIIRRALAADPKRPEITLTDFASIAAAHVA